MANKIKFRQSKQTTVPSFSAGALNVTQDSHNIYLDAETGSRSLLSTGSEAYLQWGGKNISASFSPVDAALESSLGANRLAFLSPARVKLEYSRDGGETWIEFIDSSNTELKKRTLFMPESVTTYSGIYVGDRGDLGIDRSNDRVRVSIRLSSTHDYISSLPTISSGTSYSIFNKFMLKISTQGSQNCFVNIEKRYEEDAREDNDAWIEQFHEVPISGWSGWNVINLETNAITTFGGQDNQIKKQYGELRFTFGQKSLNSESYPGLCIYKIAAYGGVGWQSPSNFAKNGHLYRWDQNQNALFPAAISATSFKGALEGNAATATKATSADSATRAAELTWNEF